MIYHGYDQQPLVGQQPTDIAAPGPVTESKTKEYRAWTNIKSRCGDPRDVAYAYYGGRGITMCSRWRRHYLTFLREVGRAPSPDHTIGRIDNDGNYEPGNVSWQTRGEQRLNRRRLEHRADCDGTKHRPGLCGVAPVVRGPMGRPRLPEPVRAEREVRKRIEKARRVKPRAVALLRFCRPRCATCGSSPLLHRRLGLDCGTVYEFQVRADVFDRAIAAAEASS